MDGQVEDKPGAQHRRGKCQKQSDSWEHRKLASLWGVAGEMEPQSHLTCHI